MGIQCEHIRATLKLPEAAVVSPSAVDQDSPQPEITVILGDGSSGKKAALNELTPVVYQDLRRLASSKPNRERAGHTLQPTAAARGLLRLIAHDQQNWRNRPHFFAVASRIMRQILVDHARKTNAAPPIALDDAVNALATFDERKSKLIELKCFGGLQGEELCEARESRGRPSPARAGWPRPGCTMI